jgi:hypothetical protein
VRVSSKLKLTISQINGLRSFIEKTDDKREYRRAAAVFQKADGKTYTALLAQAKGNMEEVTILPYEILAYR